MTRPQASGRCRRRAVLAIGVLLLLLPCAACKQTKLKTKKSAKTTKTDSGANASEAKDDNEGNIAPVAPKPIKGHPVPFGPGQGTADLMETRPLPKDYKPNWKVTSITVHNPEELGPRIFTFKIGTGKDKPVYRVDGKFQVTEKTKTRYGLRGTYSLFYGKQRVCMEHVHCNVKENEANTEASLNCSIGNLGKGDSSQRSKYSVSRTAKRVSFKRLDTKNAKKDHGPLAIELIAM